MTLNEYQVAAAGTDFSPASDWYYALGLTGESGEVAELVKKLHRQHGEWRGVTTNDALYRHKMSLELGDVLWYLSRLAMLHGITLDDVAQSNLAKLRARMEEAGFIANG